MVHGPNLWLKNAFSPAHFYSIQIQIMNLFCPLGQFRSDNFARLLSKKKPYKDTSTDNNLAVGCTNVHPKDLWQTPTSNVFTIMNLRINGRICFRQGLTDEDVLLLELGICRTVRKTPRQ